MRARQLAFTTEKTYLRWIRGFIRFRGRRHPQEMGAAEVDAYLSWLATHKYFSPATQAIVLNALVFLYKQHLGRELGALNYRRARPRRRVPQVLTHQEALALITVMHEPVRLAFQLLYGSGLRQAECLNLRDKDVDFGMHEIVVRQGDEESTVPVVDPQEEPLRGILMAGIAVCVGCLVIMLLARLLAKRKTQS